MYTNRDFLKLVLTPVNSMLSLVVVMCKDWTFFKEISFIKYENIRNIEFNCVASSRPTHTASGNFFYRMFFILLRMNRIPGLKNIIYQNQIV